MKIKKSAGLPKEVEDTVRALFKDVRRSVLGSVTYQTSHGGVLYSISFTQCEYADSRRQYWQASAMAQGASVTTYDVRL